MYLLRIRKGLIVKKKLFHSVEEICEYVKEFNILSFSVERLDIFEGFKPAPERPEAKLRQPLVPLSRATNDEVKI